MNKKSVTIPFTATQLKGIKYKRKILSKISSLIGKGIYLNGERTLFLEKKLSVMFGTYIVTVASGHDAISLALKSLNLSSTDEIVIPANSYPTAFPAYLSGMKVVACDVDINGQLDPEALQKKLTSKTKVIIAVHLYGLVGRFEEIIKIAKENKIVLIEDCAQAFGSKYKNKYVGTFGDIGCLSFYPTKNLGALGDGGAIITKNKKYYSYFLKARQYGEKVRYQSEFVSGHSRLPEIQAAIVGLYLNDFKKVIREKSQLYAFYQKAILELNLTSEIRLFESAKRSDPVVHLFTIEAKRRNQLKAYLKKCGIETMIHYPYSVNNVAAFKQLAKGRFVNSEYLSKHILSLPFHEYLTHKEVQYIVSKIRKFYEET